MAGSPTQRKKKHLARKKKRILTQLKNQWFHEFQQLKALIFILERGTMKFLMAFGIKKFRFDKVSKV